jgi:hypothetical protein
MLTPEISNDQGEYKERCDCQPEPGISQKRTFETNPHIDRVDRHHNIDSHEKEY